MLLFDGSYKSVIGAISVAICFLDSDFLRLEKRWIQVLSLN